MKSPISAAWIEKRPCTESWYPPLVRSPGDKAESARKAIIKWPIK